MSEDMLYEFVVEPLRKSLRLDHFLSEQASHISRSRLQALIKDAHVTVDGHPAKQNHKLHGGEHVILHEPAAVACEIAPENIALDVLYEDSDLIVINKPAGLVVHPAVGHSGGTLVNALLHHCEALSGIGGVERPGIVHRLDKETSGCIVIAKNDLSHQSLATQFAGREITKIYLAIVAGKLTRKSGVVDVPIGRHHLHRQRMAVVPLEKGRAAKTEWRLLQELTCGTLVECTLHTGRTHQIRVHMKHLGYPLLGDEVYGKRGNFSRQMLHAWKLGFTHPTTGERLNLVAPVPEDFKATGMQPVS
jgi:23S rRNA pseudouridine1911/1915/1917 synthase